MSVFDDFWGLITSLFADDARKRGIVAQLAAASNQTQLDAVWTTLSAKDQQDDFLKQTYNSMKGKTAADKEIQNPLTDLIGSSLDQWLETIKKYETNDPTKAKENLTKLSADVMKIAAGSVAVDLALGALPNGEGQVSAINTKQILAWLGVGAVVTAVAHDPVKIGLLRPYQDMLEQTFRNRRPDDFGLFQAYRTRELSPTKVGDLTKLDDTVMDDIENENDKIYYAEISKWGYSEAYAGALSRSATTTLNFSSLNALARQGLLSRGLAIYSLWGAGLDRTVMKPALDALMAQNKMASYEGFRAMVEPSYIEGDIDESDLVTYYDRIMVPKDVQLWILPRLKKKREAYALKQKTGAAVKERDLTVSQVQAAYQNALMDRARAQNMILGLGYQMDETKILLDLAELRRKLPSATSLKRLPLSDYEKAFKNKLITQDEVLERMIGEYSPGDIALEKRLLESGKA
jgi:hypothetical protein